MYIHLHAQPKTMCRNRFRQQILRPKVDVESSSIVVDRFQILCLLDADLTIEVDSKSFLGQMSIDIEINFDTSLLAGMVLLIGVHGLS